jgi:hypothetical protein
MSFAQELNGEMHSLHKRTLCYVGSVAAASQTCFTDSQNMLINLNGMLEKMYIFL